MIVVADASVLVGELLRKRGRALLLYPGLRVVVAEHQWSEAEHVLTRRGQSTLREELEAQDTES
jgi:hypothetical protein